VNSVALHPNQAELICGLQNGNIRVWDLAENKCTEYVRHTTQGTGDTTRHATWHNHTPRFLLRDQSLTDHTTFQAPEPEVAVRSIHVSPDGSQVVAANNKGRCYVWKLAPDSKFEPLTHIDAHKSYILKALYSPDAKYLTSFYLTTLISSSLSLPSALTCFRTPLCRILATCSADKTVKLWNTKDYKLLKTLQVGVASGLCIPLSHDRLIPFASISLSLSCSQGHGRWVWDCVFSTDSAYLVTGTCSSYLSVHSLLMSL
jgi:G protein beta subunit-like protein